MDKNILSHIFFCQSEYSLYFCKMKSPSFSHLVRKPEVSRLLGGHINYEKVSAPMRIAAMA